MTTPRIPAREAATNELSDPKYHTDSPGLFRRLVDWLWEHLSSLLSSAADASPGGWTGLLALVSAAVLLVLALRMRLGRLRPDPTSEDVALFDDGPRSADGHRAAAERHASALRWQEALQERMRAVVRSLEERALLEPRPGRTADEAAEEAGRSLPDHAEALRSAALAFDEVTYADRPADAAAYARIRDLDSAVTRATPRTPAPSDPSDDTVTSRVTTIGTTETGTGGMP